MHAAFQGPISLGARNFFSELSHGEILLNQTEIRLYLPCTDWFETKRTVLNAIPALIGGPVSLRGFWQTSALPAQ